MGIFLQSADCFLFNSIKLNPAQKMQFKWFVHTILEVMCQM